MIKQDFYEIQLKRLILFLEKLLSKTATEIIEQEEDLILISNDFKSVLATGNILNEANINEFSTLDIRVQNVILNTYLKQSEAKDAVFIQNIRNLYTVYSSSKKDFDIVMETKISQILNLDKIN